MSVKDTFYQQEQALPKAEVRAFAREELVYNVTEDLLVLLEDLAVSKKDLACKMGKSKSYITQVLSGARNMTLGSLSDICVALDADISIRINAKDAKREQSNNWEPAKVFNTHTKKTYRHPVNVVPINAHSPWRHEAA